MFSTILTISGKGDKPKVSPCRVGSSKSRLLVLACCESQSFQILAIVQKKKINNNHAATIIITTSHHRHHFQSHHFGLGLISQRGACGALHAPRLRSDLGRRVAKSPALRGVLRRSHGDRGDLATVGTASGIMAEVFCWCILVVVGWLRRFGDYFLLCPWCWVFKVSVLFLRLDLGIGLLSGGDEELTAFQNKRSCVWQGSWNYLNLGESNSANAWWLGNDHDFPYFIVPCLSC